MPKYCLYDGCTKYASFGLEWKKATHCRDHASEDMYDVKNKRCLYDDCNKQPTYGLEWGKATHCKDHASDDMMNVVSKRCLYDGCNSRPNFGLEWNKATHCKEHASDNMYDVKHKRCSFSGCDTRPTFGLESNRATHCKEHASDGMMDVKSKRCQIDDCNKIPSYGLEWRKAIYCSKHASSNMFDVVSKRCKFPLCNKIPSYGLESKKATHCKEHASDDMVDVISKRCEFPLCDTTANPKYSSYCARCYFFLSPNDPRIRNYKTKEHAFMIPLSEQYPEIILDSVVRGGCSKRRPDGLLDRLTHSIIVEIDEDQHVGYDSLCNNRRNMELFTDLGNRPVVFIRLNPDSYKVNGKCIKGVFTQSKSGELKINKKEFEKRKAALFDTVEQYLTQCPDKAISMIELFYSTE